jgi:hypothetical protein
MILMVVKGYANHETVVKEQYEKGFYVLVSYVK